MQPAFAWHTHACHCSGCLSGGGETRKLAARARRAALVVIGLRTVEGYCTCKKPPSFGARPWCDVRAVPSNAQPAFAWHARKRHCGGCLSGGGETRELVACVPCRAGCDKLCAVTGHCTGGRPLSFGARPWYDVRAVTYTVRPAFAWHAHKRHCGGCLSGRGKTRELEARARRAALALIGPRTIEGSCTGGTCLILGARPWCDVRAVASNAQPAFAWHARKRHCAGCLSGGGETQELAARASRAALAAIGPRDMKGHCIGERSLFFGAIPWCDVRAVTSNAQPAFAWHANKRHCAGCLSGGGKTRELAARARRAALAVIDSRTIKVYCTGGRSLSVGARPWVRRASCDLQRTAGFASPTRQRHCAGCVSGGEKIRELAMRARRAALVAIGPCVTEGHCTGGRPLSFAARPWCDVRAVTSNAQPAFAWHARKPDCAGCLSGGGKTRKLAARPRRAAPAVMASRTIKGYCTGGRFLTAGARPWCDVRAIASNA